MQGIVGWAAVPAMALVFTSCLSSPPVYHPRQVGPVSEAPVRGLVRVTIEPDVTTVPLGESIQFTSRIRNVGTDAVWLPREPVLVFTWVYPNGRRDNLLFDQPPIRHYSDVEAVRLKPGEEMVRRSTIETYFFPRRGVTEFAAILSVPRNTNAGLQPFAMGRYISNRYGVEITARN